MENKTIKALIVSGGGSKGAYAGGVIEHLGVDYDLYIGTSTGSLIVPLVASDSLDVLKESYTNTTQKDIFKVNPFKIKKNKNGDFESSMNFINIIYNVLIRNKKAFGDSTNLRNNISSFLTKQDYDIIRLTKKDVLVCVTNATNGNAEYKSIRDYSFDDFCDWIWASTSAFPFMDSVNKDGFEYVDGGFTDPCPIQEAINRGATEIDVIMLKTEDGFISNKKLKNPLNGLERMITIMLKEINKDDIKIASLNAKSENVRLNIYFTPRILTDNPLVFDKDLMTSWWSEGFEYAKTSNYTKYLVKGPNLENERIHY
jgi:predicted patatin/cPLA2 family phospholipase